jgi:S-formylglutathione hydrolase FrmB
MWRVSILFFAVMTVISAGEPPPEPTIVWSNPPTVALPSGVTHRTFTSALAQTEVGYCIYLPPNYEQQTTQKYPVIYNLHGNGGNENKNASDATILHDGIISGRWPAMIMVFPNGGRSTMYKNSADGKLPIESIVINELIPHIDKEFRTIADRNGRCIEGFSMGGRGATHLSMRFPTMFCSLSNMAGNVPHLVKDFDAGKKSLMLGDDRDNYLANDVYELIKKNTDTINKNMRIQIACGTQDPGHLTTVRDFHAALLAAGIDHTYLELENLTHDRKKMIELLRPIWFDYHVTSLRKFGGLP